MKQILKYKNEVILVLIILFFIGVAKNIVGRHSQKMKELTVIKKKIEEKKGLLKEWQEVNKKYASAQETFFRKDTLLFKRFIEERAQEAELDLEYLSPSYQGRGFYTEATIDLRSSASYRNIVSFLEQLEQRNVSIKKLGIRDSGKKRRVNIKVGTAILKE
jgi:hypothetical protein